MKMNHRSIKLPRRIPTSTHSGARCARFADDHKERIDVYSRAMICGSKTDGNVSLWAIIMTYGGIINPQIMMDNVKALVLRLPRSPGESVMKILLNLMIRIKSMVEQHFGSLLFSEQRGFSVKATIRRG